jgi:hypothetical protein
MIRRIGRYGFRSSGRDMMDSTRTGIDKGINFDLSVAIELARRMQVAAHDADERGKALLLLGNALMRLGEREIGMARLEEAVAAYRRMCLRPEVRSSAPEVSRLAAPQSAELPLAFGPEPTTQPVYCVSYAWNDDTPDSPNREAIVNKLCAAAESRGIHILRDKTDLRLGDHISAFMHRLAQGDRVSSFSPKNTFARPTA